jgi:prephenate dehydrogenase
MKPSFPKVAILGLGLIGGSIALDLKKRRLARHITGYNRSAASRRLALRRKACDAVFSDPSKAVQDADLVILATPVRHIPALARQIAASLKPGALVTDVGSTKEKIAAQVRRALKKENLFVGGHPIAGTEHSGMAAAVAGLFQDRWWILTPNSNDAKTKGAVAQLSALWKKLGAKVQVMSPREHDQILAGISHLPHMMAYSLMHAVMAFQKGVALRFAGSSFRDVTRITASSAEMWTDICLENRAALLKWVQSFEKVLTKLKKGIAKGDARALQRFFSTAAKTRSQL